MIEVLKMAHNIYHAEVSPDLRCYPKSNTGGNEYKLCNHMFHCVSSARLVQWSNHFGAMCSRV